MRRRWISLNGLAEEEQAGGAGSGGYYVGPAVAGQIGYGESVGCSFSVAEGDSRSDSRLSRSRLERTAAVKIAGPTRDP